ncbi:MAG: tRNA pseudouridine(38-40) synthase TruA [Bdellovibrionales bacterium]|nr:tRNA pseudouridine(38-40) synthase TruA [Bdellovibrionales bacterium]
MYKILLNVAYDGKDYYGWQRQEKWENTVQGVLELHLSRIFNKKVTVVGSGRTDRGTHALSQWAHSNVPKDPTNMNLAYRLNRMTPDTLRIKGVYLAPNNFHAQRSVVKKKYIYRIDNNEFPNPFDLHYSHHVKKPLDVNLLNNLASCLVGKQDFASFQTSGTEVETTVRTIFEAYWEVRKGHRLVFHVVGDGFLKQMVRNLVGTMLWCATKKEAPALFRQMLESRDRRESMAAAPAHGLFLKWVKYPSELDNKCRKL